MDYKITDVSIRPISIKNNPPCKHIVFSCSCLVNRELYLSDIKVTMAGEFLFEYASFKNVADSLSYIPLGNLKSAIECKLKEEIQASALSR